MEKRRLTKTVAIILAVLFTLSVSATVSTFAQEKPDLEQIFKEARKRKGKRPLIFIPGIMGSELVHEDTGEKLWFSFSRSKNEDLRLPIALNLKSSRDKLIPGDIVRKVNIKFLPDVQVYSNLVKTLTEYGGYAEASWENPPESLEDKFFVFPYDWRRDNVETARYLIEEIEELKRRVKRPDAKFNVLAHSMGGLIVRYAAMYGKSDIRKGRLKPSWIGERHFGKIFFFGSPNEGSAEALRTLLRGKSSIGGSMKLPFVRYLTPVDIATMPAIFQLLPNLKTTRFYNENLKPIKIDLYNIKNWRKYGWAIYSNKKHLEGLSEAEIGRLEQYFRIVLRRAKRFHEALDAKAPRRGGSEMYLVGGDCYSTLDAMIVYKNDKQKWITLTSPDSFQTSTGVKVRSSQLRSLMYSPGDGRVSRKSLLGDGFDDTGFIKQTFFVCERHDAIMNNRTIQNNVLTLLINEARKLEPAKAP